MPDFSLSGLLYVSFGLVMAGNIGVTFCYWWNCEYKLAGIFLCYAVASAVFMTVEGVR